jgi:hypothetical protein
MAMGENYSGPAEPIERRFEKKHERRLSLLEEGCSQRIEVLQKVGEA